MSKVILSISGMTCSACSSGLEKYLNKQKGIIDATVNLVLAQASISYDNSLTIDDLNRFVKEAGFESLGITTCNVKQNHSKEKRILICFTLLTIIIMYISMGHMIHLPSIPFLNMNKYPINYTVCLFILTIPFMIYGIDILQSGYKSLIHKTPNMDTLVSVGVLTSVFYSIYSMIMVFSGDYNYLHKLYFESSVMVIFFIKFGRLLDKHSKEKTKSAIKDLVQITPTIGLLSDGTEVMIDEINKGDILIVKPGMKVAVDGIIINGYSHFDEAFLTGESIPVKKGINDPVMAGTINIDGVVQYRAEKIGRDSTISEIVHLVMEAINTKAPIARLADKVSGYFVPIIILIALVALIVNLFMGMDTGDTINTFVTILVVACPCALGLATPLSIVVSEGVCAKNGILVKNSEVLENASKVDTIIFDKTGTLTYGTLKVSKVFTLDKYKEDYLLKLVASLESNSSHPISTAFKDYPKFDDVDDFTNIEGIGLSGIINGNKIYVGNSKILDKLDIEFSDKEYEHILANQGNSIIYVVLNNKVIGIIGVKDIIRSNVKEIIRALKQMDKEIIMLTGDNEVSALVVAKELEIDKVIANVLPKDKTKVIKSLRESGKKVMMIGDGINDAPSLVSADIGVSVSSGTDIALDSANVILIHNELLDIVNLINISKKTVRIIKQNLFWAFFYNFCMIPIAMGLFQPFNIGMNPMLASLAMTLSSLTVTINTLRLSKIKIERVDKMFHKGIKTVLKIDGMHCEHCAKKVENALLNLDSVVKVKVNLAKKEVIISSNLRLDNDLINKLLTDLDYQLIDIKQQ